MPLPLPPQNALAAAVVAVGGNLRGAFPSVEAVLDVAVGALPEAGLRVLKRSRWRRTPAWPDPTDPEFVNAALIVETRLSPHAALAALHAVEARLGRERSVRNAPRTVDLDLIAYDALELRGRGLILPHPRARERLFVLEPLAEIAPDWHWPVGTTAAESLAALRLRCAAA